MIVYIFGEKVASQVEALTRVKPYGKISSAETLDILLQQEKYDVALIKIFDRKHNLQTIGAKSPEKMKRIILETMEEFIIVAMHLKIPTITQDLVALCYRSLPIPQSDQHNHFMDNFQPLFPISTDVITQIRTLK